MSFPLLEKPLFEAGGHYLTFLGLIAFAGFFAAGLVVARFLQSEIVRRFFSRFKIDVNFIAIVTTILSVAAIVFFTVTAINAAGIPLAWNASLPAIKLSLVQIFLLVALLIAVFWISSRTKRFLCPGEHRHSSRRAGGLRRCGWRRRWLRSAKYREQLHQRPSDSGRETDHHWGPGRSGGHCGAGGAHPRAQHSHSHERQHH